MSKRYAGAALLGTLMLTGCSSGSSSSAGTASFTPGAGTSAPVPTSAGAPAATSTPPVASTSAAVSAPPATSAVATSAAASSKAAPTVTSTAAPTDEQRAVDQGHVSMAGKKFLLDYSADATSDPQRIAALTDFGDFERTVMLTYADHDPADPLIAAHSIFAQQQTLITGVKSIAAKNQSTVGVLRIWNAKVTGIRTTSAGPVATVTSCGSQKKWFAVSDETGKVVPDTDTEDNRNYLQTSYLLDSGDGHWRVSLINPVNYFSAACPQ